MRKSILVLLILLIAGCTEVEQASVTEENEMMEDEAMEKEVVEDKSVVDWKETSLKDVLTGEQFEISDFKGKPVLLESFAVWCPTCKRQQDEVKKLHEEIGMDAVSISLDTDPNEDEEQVLEHANKHGFDWRFAISPEDMTKSLIDEFGIGVVNAPSAPVVLICEDQSTRLLERGVKSAEELKAHIEQGC